MRDQVPTCPKCSVSMDTGFVLDRTHGANAQETWVDGAPEPSIWTGLRVKGQQLIPVRTFRCPKCGYLESYARES